ncbi:hypothetical protein SH449x_003001 [Pirellulaceae bacterium SH449]
MNSYLRYGLAICLGSMGGIAMASKPSLEKITPPIGTRGSSFEVTAIGSGLGDIKNVVFYEPGLSCKSIEASQDEEIRIVIEAEPNCRLGNHPIRLSGPNGVSEIRLVTISPFPVLREEEATGKPLPSNQTVFGTLEGDAVDSYELSLVEGDTFSAEIHAMRLGVGFLDTKVELRNSEGVLVAASDDTPLTGQDPILSIRVPQSGRYRIDVTSVDGRADADSPYALHVGTFPRPHGIFPLGISANSKQVVAALHADKEIDSSYEISSVGLEPGTQFVEVIDDGVSCPSLVPVRVFDGTVLVYSERNGNDTAATLAVPCSIQGIIREAGQKDQITFTTPSSGMHRIEVFASRVGSKLDSVIELRDSEGWLVATGDDFDGLDSRIDFVAEEGKSYSVSIFDKRENADFNTHYCLEVTPVKTALTAFLPRRDKRSQARQTIEVPRGNRVLTYFGVRKEATDQKVAIGLTNLPSSLSVQSAREQTDSFVIPVVIEAAVTGAEVDTLAGVINTVTGSEMDFEQVIDLISLSADRLFHGASVNRIVVATTNPNPFRVDLEPIVVPLASDGTLELKVRVHRDDDFDLPIELKLSYLPEWVEAAEKIVVPANQSEALVSIRAYEGVKRQEWPLVVEATASLPARAASDDGEERRPRRRSRSPLDFSTVASSIELLRIIETPCTGTIDPISAEQSQTVTVRCQMNLGSGLPDQLTATLEGLPNRVTAEAVEIDRNTSTVTFELTMADDAPLGTFPDLYCRLSGELNGTPVSYCLARETKLVISKLGESMKDENGNPLSPLDALRRKSATNNLNNNP